MWWMLPFFYAWLFVSSAWGWCSLVSAGVSPCSPVQLRFFSLMEELEPLRYGNWGHSEVANQADFCRHLVWLILKDESGVLMGGDFWGPAWGNYETFSYPEKPNFFSSLFILNAVFMIQQAQDWEKCQTDVCRQVCLLCLFTVSAIHKFDPAWQRLKYLFLHMPSLLSFSPVCLVLHVYEAWLGATRELVAWCQVSRPSCCSVPKPLAAISISLPQLESGFFILSWCMAQALNAVFGCVVVE